MSDTIIQVTAVLGGIALTIILFVVWVYAIPALVHWDETILFCGFVTSVIFVVIGIILGLRECELP